MAEIKNKYIFPNKFAEWMSKVDQRTQYEASMMSMTLIMIGMIISIIYAFIYTDFKLWFKIVLVFNGLAGITFMTSYLITTFQQFQNYMQAKALQELIQQDLTTMKGGEEHAEN